MGARIELEKPAVNKEAWQPLLSAAAEKRLTAMITRAVAT
jgi:hypothetical protein